MTFWGFDWGPECLGVLLAEDAAGPGWMEEQLCLGDPQLFKQPSAVPTVGRALRDEE